MNEVAPEDIDSKTYKTDKYMVEDVITREETHLQLMTLDLEVKKIKGHFFAASRR